LHPLARKLFGFYRETHLKNVIAGWNDFQAIHGCCCPELSEKLANLWAKAHSEPILLSQPEVFVFGNSQIEDAEVVGIAQLFSDPDNSKFCGQILSESYHKRDVIIVEGIDANMKIDPKEDSQTFFLTKTADVYGWEPIGYKELKDKIFEPLIYIEKKYASHIWMIKKLLADVNFTADSSEFRFHSGTRGELTLEEEEKLQLWQTLLDDFINNLILTIQQIHERLIDKEKQTILSTSDTSIVENFKKTYQTFLITPKHEHDCSLLQKSLEDLRTHYNLILLKAKYNSLWTAEQENFFKNSWPLRQKSLCNEINYHREQNKRIFVCAGIAHFFPNRGTGVSEVMETLSQYKFAVAIRNIPHNATYYSFADLAKKFMRQKD
jgi:hypothetical protein